MTMEALYNKLLVSFSTSKSFFLFLPHSSYGIRSRNLKIEDAIQQSKQNIEKYYTLVGITEEMLNTMKLLEKLFPELLPRIHKKYINKNKGKLVDFFNNYPVYIVRCKLLNLLV